MDSSATIHHAAAPTATLLMLPTEVLLMIAEYLVEDDITFPATNTDLRYAPRHAPWSTGRYWNILLHPTFVPYSTPWQGSSRDIVSLALTHRRMAGICAVPLYRSPVIDFHARPNPEHKQLRQFLNSINTNPRLSQHVRQIAVQYTTGQRAGWIGGVASLDARWHWDANFTVLRDVEISGLGGEIPHLQEWYRLLPTLPSLKRLCLREIRGVSRGFPLLPSLKEAHFYLCAEGPGASSASMLRNLPDLRILAINDCYLDVAEDSFQAFEDTLETLSWVECASTESPPLHRLRGLKHLKTTRLEALYGGPDGTFLPFLNLAPTLETAEVAMPWGFPRYLPCRHPLYPDDRDLYAMECFLELMEKGCRLQYTRLSVIDIRAYHTTLDFKRQHWSKLREIFETARARFARMGVTFLYQEIPELRLNRHGELVTAEEGYKEENGSDGDYSVHEDEHEAEEYSGGEEAVEERARQPW